VLHARKVHAIVVEDDAKFCAGAEEDRAVANDEEAGPDDRFHTSVSNAGVNQAMRPPIKSKTGPRNNTVRSATMGDSVGAGDNAGIVPSPGFSVAPPPKVYGRAKSAPKATEALEWTNKAKSIMEGQTKTPRVTTAETPYGDGALHWTAIHATNVADDYVKGVGEKETKAEINMWVREVPRPPCGPPPAPVPVAAAAPPPPEEQARGRSTHASIADSVSFSPEPPPPRANISHLHGPSAPRGTSKFFAGVEKPPPKLKAAFRIMPLPQQESSPPPPATGRPPSPPVQPPASGGWNEAPVDRGGWGTMPVGSERGGDAYPGPGTPGGASAAQWNDSRRGESKYVASARAQAQSLLASGKVRRALPALI